MFQIPEDKLPDFAKDEHRISVLFAPLRNRTVNPRDWENKISSWKTLISRYCLCNEVYSFTLSSLNKVFVRNGRPPICLKEVMDQMVKDGEIQHIDRYLSKTSATWSGWATDVLIKKPLAWSFSKIKNTIFVSNDDITFVDLDLIKTKCTELVSSIPKEYLNKIISLPELLNIFHKETTFTPNLKLLLHQLANECKVHIVVTHTKTDEESYMIKFADGNKVTPINEVDIGIYSLEKNEKILIQVIEKLEDEIKHLINQAKLHLSKGHRQTAKTCLRKKHEIEKRIAMKADALHNIQLLLERIKDTHTDAHVWESYKLALESFNTTFKDSGLTEDAIEDTMIKLGEVMDIHEDIQSSLSKPVKDVSASESDLEQELADIVKSEDNPDDKGNMDDVETQLKHLNLNLPDLSESNNNSSTLEMPMTT